MSNDSSEIESSSEYNTSEDSGNYVASKNKQTNKINIKSKININKETILEEVKPVIKKSIRISNKSLLLIR
jgi:hypothetical protein